MTEVFPGDKRCQKPPDPWCPKTTSWELAATGHLAANARATDELFECNGLSDFRLQTPATSVAGRWFKVSNSQHICCTLIRSSETLLGKC